MNHSGTTAIENNNMIVNQINNQQSTTTQPNSNDQPVHNQAGTSPSDTKEPTKDDFNKMDLNRETTSQKGSEQDASSQNNTNAGGDDKNESSTLSTAFTISFEDDAPANSKKQFGIRDSIRKFAPPKPHTIEKPRPPKNEQSQENSYMSIESAPGGCLPKQTFRRDAANSSCRSDGRKSDSSRHSNISESAAFLINKMLNCKQGESLSSICLNSAQHQRDKKNRSKGGASAKKLAHSSGDILDDEIDFCEEKSDNGTYIVGADPESDAARRKIDELFGVVKAAEASLMAGHRNKPPSGRPMATVTRSSRQPDKRPMNRERQEHLNRLATGRNSSRSSSSSRQELPSTSHRPRSVTRQSRNSSCDQTSKLPRSRHRRAASQSSRQSSNREVSDGDTQSSRSSLHHDAELINQEMPQINNPGMKFNRAFALRRARLGLGEPAPAPRMTSTPNTTGELDSPNMSPRRNIGVSHRYGQANSSGGSGGTQQNMSRNDGGRFSLRMKNNPMSSRLVANVTSDRVGHQAPMIDSYLSRISGPSRSTRLVTQTSSLASSHQNPVHSSSAIPYQSSDELELLVSPSRFRTLNAKSSSLLRKDQQSELDTDLDYAQERFNYSLGMDPDSYKLAKGGNRACSSATGRQGSSGRLGALDCLVISAISTLSVKIRGSVCDLMVEHAKRLPTENETRLVVEEILPQLTANSSRPKSPTSIEEIDQSLYFDLAQTLKNLKKVEQMVDVMKLISNQIIDSPTPSSSSGHNSNSKSPNPNRNQANKTRTTVVATTTEGSESNPNSESNSLSPV